MVNHVTTDSVVNINVGGKTMAVIYLNDEDQDFLIFHMKLEADCGKEADAVICLLYTSPSPRDKRQSRMPSSA